MGLQTSLDLLPCSRMQEPASSSLNLPLGQKYILYTHPVSPPVRGAEQPVTSLDVYNLESTDVR